MVWRRYFANVVVVLICLGGALSSARAGLSRLFAEYGTATNSLEATRRAVNLNPLDPEAHSDLGLRLEDAGRTEEAVLEFERATSTRPQDYFFWQELGRAREENGNSESAVAALRQAIVLAPDYAQPHWQLGNVLLRKDKFDQGFAELRRAAESDPSLFAPAMDLAWSIREGDARSLSLWCQPHNDSERLSLASFLIGRNRIDEAMDILRRTSGNISPEDRLAITSALIAAGKFPEAHEVWAKAVGINQTSQEAIFDGDFEGAINSSEQAFGWKPTQATQTVHLLLDPNASQSGKRSLRLDYAGGFDPAVPVISQLVLVAAHTRYRLSFSARIEDLKSAALPLVVVKDAEGHQQIMGQSATLADVSEGWHQFTIDFETTDTMTAVTINIQRQPCASSPCPIFGRAWFDNFFLKRI